MPRIDVIDSTWIGAAPAEIAPVVADPANWARWWPGLDLTLAEARGPKGVRWLVRGVREGGPAGLHGSAEIWLQPVLDGAVAHFFLRLDPAGGTTLRRRRALRVERRYRVRTKAALWAVADRLEPARALRAAAPGGTIPGRGGTAG